MHGEEVFDLEAEGSDPAEPSHTTTSAPSTPTSTVGKGTTVIDGVELSRKAIEVQEEEAGVCPICLDEFVDADPGMRTTCGHCYHLQCIMQWSQRSRECPMCFRALALEDESMNELLPFGEYIPPEGVPGSLGEETWDLERLLIRLAAVGQQQERRAARRAARRASLLSAPQPIAERVQGGHRSRPAPMGSERGSPPGPVSPISRGGYPASWPPAGEGAANPVGGSAAGASGSRGTGDEAESPSVGPTSSFKSRLAKLKFRESFNKATKELKSALFSPSRSQGGGEGGDHSLI